MLAGCGGDNPGEQGTPPESTDREFVTTEFNTIRNNNFNPYDNLYWPNQSVYYLFGNLLHLSQKNNELVPAVATGMERDGTTVTVNLDDRYTWHDGDPVTAEDVVAQYTLDLLVERRNWQRAFEDVRAADEHTVEIEVAEGTNDLVLEDFILNTTVATKPSVYEQWLPEDGSRGQGAYDDVGPAQLTQMRGSLRSFDVTVPFDQEPEDDGRGRVVGCGPWKLVEKGERIMTFEVYEDHPHAENINFPRVKFEEFTTNENRYQALLSDNLSGLDLVVTQTVWEQIPDHYVKYIFNRWLGMGLAFSAKAFPDPRVRRALAFAMDKDTIVANSGIADELVSVHDFDSALYAGADAHAEYFGDDLVDQLTKYDQNTERAAELLRAAGWSRDGGQWFDANDERVSVTINTAVTWPEWGNMAGTAAQHLTDFGIEANHAAQELVVYYGQTMPQVDYEIAAWWCGGARNFPWFAYNVIWNGLQTVTDDHGHPAQHEVPMPVGNPQGNTETVDIDQLLTDLAQKRTGSDEHQRVARKLAWSYNQLLPVYCLNENKGLASLDGRNWTAPDPDSEEGQVFFPLSYMQHMGQIQAL